MLFIVARNLLIPDRTGNRSSEAIGVVLIWIRLLSHLKDTSQMFSTFVLMTLQVAQSLGTFVTLLFIFLIGFAHAFWLLYKDFCVVEVSDLHETRTRIVVDSLDGVCEEGEPTLWKSYLSSLWHVGMGAVGEFGQMMASFPPSAETPEDDDGLGEEGIMRNFNSEELWLWVFLMLIPIVLMNILIAIVSDSYDSAMARSDRLY